MAACGPCVNRRKSLLIIIDLILDDASVAAVVRRTRRKSFKTSNAVVEVDLMKQLFKYIENVL